MYPSNCLYMQTVTLLQCYSFCINLSLCDYTEHFWKDHHVPTIIRLLFIMFLVGRPFLIISCQIRLAGVGKNRRKGKKGED